MSTVLLTRPRISSGALRSITATSEAFTAGARAFGELKPGVLRAWARWDLRFGILSKPLDVSKAFDTTLVGPAPEP